MAVAAVQGADQPLRSSLGFCILPKELFNMQTRGIKPATFQ